MKIREYTEAVKNGSIDVTSVVTEALRRAEKNENNAFITVTRERAEEQVRQLDTSLPLAGVTFALKDNICTEGILTTCGSEMLRDHIPLYNATVYERIAAAGGVLIGKSNMDEFAMGSEGVLSVFGETKNPREREYIAGGSSSGSAVAVADGTVMASLGSDTGGSSRLPSALCGCVAMSPTYGRVSRYGLVAYASSLDRICPITGNIEDNRLLLSVISGADGRDCSMDLTLPPIENANGDTDAAVFLPKGCSPAVAEAVRFGGEVLGAMAGIELPSFEKITDIYYTVCSAEASSCLARYDGVRYGRRINNNVPATRSTLFGNTVKNRIASGGYYRLSDGGKAYFSAEGEREKIKAEMNRIFERYGVVVMPATLKEKYSFGEYDEDDGNTALTAYSNLSGLPSLVLPCLKASVQLMAGYGQESLLYAVGEKIERAQREATV